MIKRKNYELFFWNKPEGLVVRHEAIENKDLSYFLIYKKDWKEKDFSKTVAHDIHFNGRALEFEPQLFDNIPWPWDYPVGSKFDQELDADEELGFMIGIAGKIG